MPEDAKRLDCLLSASRTRFADLLDRVERLAPYEAVLRECLGDTDGGALRAVMLRDHTLIIHADNAAAATAARYRREEVLALLRTRLGDDCREIEIKIRPAPVTSRFGRV